MSYQIPPLYIDVVPTNVQTSELVKRSAELDSLIAGQQHALSYTDEQVKRVIEAQVQKKVAQAMDERDQHEHNIRMRAIAYQHALNGQGGTPQADTIELDQLRKENTQLKQILKLEAQP